MVVVKGDQGAMNVHFLIKIVCVNLATLHRCKYL